MAPRTGRFILAALLSCAFGQASFACDIAPNYLLEEELIYSVGVKDLITDSDTIIKGQFLEYGDTENVVFTIVKTLKINRPHNEIKTIDVTFADVKHYFEGSTEDGPNDFGVTLLEAQLKYGGHDSGGWGGELSGISHYVDCERFIILDSDKTYLLFLDESDEVKALFPVSDKIEELFPALQNKIDRLVTKKP